jgi:hypothetical protein
MYTIACRVHHGRYAEAKEESMRWLINYSKNNAPGISNQEPTEQSQGCLFHPYGSPIWHAWTRHRYTGNVSSFHSMGSSVRSCPGPQNANLNTWANSSRPTVKSCKIPKPDLFSRGGQVCMHVINKYGLQDLRNDTESVGSRKSSQFKKSKIIP